MIADEICITFAGRILKIFDKFFAETEIGYILWEKRLFLT